MQTSQEKAAGEPGLLFGHPKGLYVLFLTETWERFSYYGMRALLVLYLTQRYLLSDDRSFAIYGAYTALVYLSPLLGGMIADRFFGYRKSVIVGGALMIAGHFGFALQDFYYAGTVVSGSTANSPPGLQAFYISMAFLITGVGFLKGNISTMVGGLYSKESRLRDSGFVIFFWGVNIGATLSSFSCGYVGQTYGWGYGFGLAGLGMCAGLATFLTGRKHLPLDTPPSHAVAVALFGLQVPRRLLPIGAILATFVLSWGLMQRAEVTGYLVVGTVAAAFAWTIHYSLKHMDKIERERLWCALIIWAMWACYAALIEQTGSSLNLFAARLVDLHLAGFEIQASQMQGATTLFLLVVSPFFAWLWVYLDRHKLNPPTPPKLSLAIFALAAGFGAIALGSSFADSAGNVNIAWLILTYLCFAIAALILQPIGLSTVTRLTADRIVGFMVGLWMLAVAIGSYIAAQIAKLSSLDSSIHKALPPAQLLAHYQKFFIVVGLSALALALMFLALTPVMRRWMHGMR
jgi:proton-dependent oligopeptide transporter, POT family